MASKEILDYIKSMAAQGHSRGAIYNALVKSGWAENDIIDGFHVSRIPFEKPAPTAVVTSQGPARKAQQPVNWPITMLFLLVLLSGIFVLMLEIIGFTDFIPGFGPTQPDFQIKAVTSQVEELLPFFISG